MVLGYQHVSDTFFVCMPYSLALKLSAVAFSSGHVTPPRAIIALNHGVHETRARPQSGHARFILYSMICSTSAR